LINARKNLRVILGRVQLAERPSNKKCSVDIFHEEPACRECILFLEKLKNTSGMGLMQSRRWEHDERLNVERLRNN
jgi:hypothetical protein